MIALDPTATFSPANPIVPRYDPDGTLDQSFRSPGAPSLRDTCRRLDTPSGAS